MPPPQSAAGRPPQWRGVRLHVVTGKGGAGKTTVAAALAVALAAGGRRVLLVEVEERQGLAQVLGTPPLTYEERHLVTVPGGGEVVGLAVDPHEALMEYLALFYKLRRAGKALERIGAVDFATTVAPGLRDVLLTGKVYEAARRRDGSGSDATFTYDAVVVDAPPTGRITRFLGVTTDVAGLAKVGPIHRQAQSIDRLFRSARTIVHLVTLLEDMPAEETIEAVEALRQERFNIGAIVLNGVRRPIVRPRDLNAIADGSVDTAAVGASLSKVGLGDPATARVLLAQASDYADRVALERKARRRLVKLGYPTFDLPAMSRGIDAAAITVLADDLRQQDAV